MADSLLQCRFGPAAFDLNHVAIDTDDSSSGSPTSEPTSSVSAVSADSSCSSSSSAAFAASTAGSFLGCGLIRLSNEEDDKVQNLIKCRFLSGLGQLREKTTVEAIYKNCYSSPTAQARAQAFQIYLQATRKKRASNPNVKYAWYSSSKEHIQKILSFGFGHCKNIAGSDGLYGSGVYLSPDNHPLESAKLAPVDKDGLRHLLLCRVILGQPELVHPGSRQYHPSSQDFDSGVDSLSSPKKYIVWSTHMNTHVISEYVISFRMPCCLKGLLERQSSSSKPISPWIPFPMLISELSKILPEPTMGSISNYHKDYKEKKISRQELIRKLRQFTGDKLLIAIIKSFRNKQLGAAGGLP